MRIDAPSGSAQQKQLFLGKRNLAESTITKQRVTDKEKAGILGKPCLPAIREIAESRGHARPLRRAVYRGASDVFLQGPLRELLCGKFPKSAEHTLPPHALHSVAAQ